MTRSMTRSKAGCLEVLAALFSEAAGASGLASNGTFIQILTLPYTAVRPWASRVTPRSLHFLFSDMK